MLYIIATPIGNLDDITNRALDVFNKLDVLFCEDTRTTGKLLKRYTLSIPMQSYHEEAHDRKINAVIEALKTGKTVGFVSDAGTPGVSDPGARLIEAVLEVLPETEITPIPGVSAASAIISISGFPAHGYTFLGFPPHKKGRATFIKEALDQPRPTVLYESPHRIGKLLDMVEELAPDRRMVVARELTKLHETIYRGTATNIKVQLEATSGKGEFTLVIDRAPKIKVSVEPAKS